MRRPIGFLVLGLVLWAGALQVGAEERAALKRPVVVKVGGLLEVRSGRYLDNQR